MDRDVGLLDRRFWTTCPGMAVIGIGGFGRGASAATAMLVFRPHIEPLMPYVFPVVTGLLGRHTHSAIRYEPADYFWIAGGVQK